MKLERMNENIREQLQYYLQNRDKIIKAEFAHAKSVVREYFERGAESFQEFPTVEPGYAEEFAAPQLRSRGPSLNQEGGYYDPNQQYQVLFINYSILVKVHILQVDIVLHMVMQEVMVMNQEVMEIKQVVMEIKLVDMEIKQVVIQVLVQCMVVVVIVQVYILLCFLVFYNGTSSSSSSCTSSTINDTYIK